MKTAHVTITHFPSQTLPGDTVFQAYHGKKHLATTVRETQAEAEAELRPKAEKALHKRGLTIGSVKFRPHSIQPPEEKERL